MARTSKQVQFEVPPRLNALLGQAVHTSVAPARPLLVELALHVQVRASALLMLFAGQATHAPPAARE